MSSPSLADNTTLLTDAFISNYPEFPKHMTPLGQFVYYRTYSRFIPSKGRRETWKETCRRSVEYNVKLGLKHLEKIGYTVPVDELKKEAQALFHSQFNLKQFLSGRTLWVGGAESGIADKYPLSNFNCSFLNVKSWSDMGDLFYLLLVGTGVGFRNGKEMAAVLPPVKTKFKLELDPYFGIHKDFRSDDTVLARNGNTARITVGDSKEGWVESLRRFLEVIGDPEYKDIDTIKINFNNVRPKGERLKTFGGTASGPEPLIEMFQGFENVIKNRIDSHLAPIEVDENGYGKLRPIHVLDMGNLVGANVVVGGVRRTAEIFLMDADDFECIFAKYGINGLWSKEQFDRHEHIKSLMVKNDIPVPTWFDEVGTKWYTIEYEGALLDDNDVEIFVKKYLDVKEIEAYSMESQLNGKIIAGPFNHGRPLHHRRMSNNSIAFTKKPSRQMLNFVFEMMQLEGEPGFINMEEANRRRPNAEGLNPCAEILLDSYGVCNLTTVNLVEFVVYDRDGNVSLDVEGLLKAQEMSARAGLRMTLATLELPHWDAVQQRDRLLGTSLTGVKDALAMVHYTEEQERTLLAMLGKVARNEADRYAKEMRVSSPLLVTTVKPEGTISQVAGGVSSGLHWSHSPYYIRRIRINAADPLAQVVRDLGWTVNPEVGTPGENYDEQMANARTFVIDFPVSSGARETKDDVSAARQFDTYFRFQENYTEHNSSNTITVRPDEWDGVEDIVFEKWDEFTAVSFLALDGGTYAMAPYEACTFDQYAKLKNSMKAFDPDVLAQYETTGESELDDEACETGGACPVR